MNNVKIKPRSGACPDEGSEEAIATLVSELRTPLQTVALWAKLLQLGALTAEQSVRAIDTILRSAMAQAHLLDNLLERTRLFRGEVVMMRGPVEMRPPVGRAEGIALSVVDAGSATTPDRSTRISALSRATSGRCPRARAGGEAMHLMSPQQLVYAALVQRRRDGINGGRRRFRHHARDVRDRDQRNPTPRA